MTHRQSAERVAAAERLIATMRVVLVLLVLVLLQMGVRVGVRMPRRLRLVCTASASPQIRIRRQTLKEAESASIAFEGPKEFLALYSRPE